MADDVVLEGRELRLIQLISALDVAIANAERTTNTYGGRNRLADAQFLINALRDVRTELRGIINGR